MRIIQLSKYYSFNNSNSIKNMLDGGMTNKWYMKTMINNILGFNLLIVFAIYSIRKRITFLLHIITLIITHKTSVSRNILLICQLITFPLTLIIVYC